MAAEVYGVHRPLGPVQSGTGGRRPREPSTAPSFGEVLRATMGPQREVAFSSHARERLQMRRIDLDPKTQMRLTDAVDRAAAKGGRSSLILMDDLVFVVSVPNRTVITAMDRAHYTDNVFTHIDSAVVM